MSSFWSTFAVSFIGSMVAVAIVRRLEKRLVAPQSTFSEALVEAFPKPLTLTLAAYLAIFAWVCLLALSLTFLAEFAGLTSEFLFLPYTMGAFFALTVCYMVVATGVRCPKCESRVLVQSVSAPPFSTSIYGTSGWSAVVVQIALRRTFQCMYCGQNFHVHYQTRV